MSSAPIYLDHNATTPLLPSVLEAMTAALRDGWGNPSSAHAPGRHARQLVEQARARVAALLGCDADEVFFTSGGTESNNLAIRGMLTGDDARGGIITSIVEHPATARPCDALAGAGHVVTRLAVDADGRVDLQEARRAVGGKTRLVTVMHSNNETGVLQPVTELASMAHAVGAFMHTDAAQSVGKVPVDVRALGVDLLSVAGHKLHAPKGVGALYVRRGTPLRPFMLGAGHERGLRPGTENTASIVGLGVACDVARRDLQEEGARVGALRARLWGRLQEGVPGVELNGHAVLRLPNTLNVRFPRVSGTRLLAHAPCVLASTGSACHAGHEEPSAVLLAMGVPGKEALGSVRLTLGRSTTEADVDNAARELVAAWSACRA